MADFDTAYKPVAAWEGGWCDVPGDSGGETYCGCARNFFPTEPIWTVIDREKAHPSFRQGAHAFSRHLAGMPQLTGMVKGWYRREWWDKLNLDALEQTVANELFEQSVNLGKGGMGRHMQRLCNALNWRNDGTADGGRLFDDLKEDGVIGRRTLAAFAFVLTRTDARRVVHLFNCMQGAHYVRIAAAKFRLRKFCVGGWPRRTYDPGQEEV